MIDESGYRSGVGIILLNENRQVFFAKRIGMPAWQFPQGGMKEGESPEEAMYRELKEEIGLNPEDVEILGFSKRWLRYRLPSRLVRYHVKPVCIGQKQRWFLLRLKNKGAHFNLQGQGDGHAEFDSFAWVSYWYPVRQVVGFKRRVYMAALKELSKALPPKASSTKDLKDSSC